MIDSHAHLLEIQKRGIDVAGELRAAREAGISLIVDIATDPDEFETRLALPASAAKAASCDMDDFPGIAFCAALSPSHKAYAETKRLLELLRAQASDPRVVAIGEFGLDYYQDYAPAATQIELLEAELEIAIKVDKPVIIHCREAHADLYPRLKALRPPRGGILHCFSMGVAEVKAYVDIGFHVSFAGNLTYKKTDALREAARYVPEDFLLVETDAPWLSPVPHRGKANTPAYVAHTLKLLSELRNADKEKLEASIDSNLYALLGLHR